MSVPALIWMPTACVTFVGAASFLTVCILQKMPSILEKALPLLIAMGAGALLGDSIGHLLPESFGAGVEHRTASLLFVSIMLLLAMFESPDRPEGTVKAVLFANFFHNFVDGVLIGTSFLLGEKSGLLSTFAILLHEIPHELGVFGIIVDRGMRISQAVAANAASAICAICGTALALVMGTQSAHYAVVAEPGVAAVFIYIACADLLPSIASHALRLRIGQILTAFASAALLIVLD